MSEAPSPLLSTSTDALALIFTADPTTYDDATVLTVVQELQRRRNAYLSDEAAKSLKTKPAKTKAEVQTPAAAALLDKPPTELSLDDI